MNEKLNKNALAYLLLFLKWSLAVLLGSRELQLKNTELKKLFLTIDFSTLTNRS